MLSMTAANVTQPYQALFPTVIDEPPMATVSERNAAGPAAARRGMPGVGG
jgi:hypothetical protein